MKDWRTRKSPENLSSITIFFLNNSIFALQCLFSEEGLRTRESLLYKLTTKFLAILQRMFLSLPCSPVFVFRGGLDDPQVTRDSLLNNNNFCNNLKNSFFALQCLFLDDCLRTHKWPENLRSMSVCFSSRGWNWRARASSWEGHLTVDLSLCGIWIMHISKNHMDSCYAWQPQN